jgi:hypothetical protein
MALRNEQTPPNGIPVSRGGAVFAPASPVLAPSDPNWGQAATGPRVTYANPLVSPKPKPDAGNGGII